MTRSLRASAAFLALALGLALTSFASWSHRSAGVSLQPECPPADIPLALDKSLGVNADLSPYSQEARSLALDEMSRAGLGWLRQRFPWDKIEEQHGVYEWAVWDAVVDDVARHNIELVAVLDGSPAWARSAANASNPLAPPHESSDYGAFVAAFATRYADKIDYYELWDEPNIAPHWGEGWVDPSGYLRLLREGAIELRSVDPGAVVLLAAVAPNVEAGGVNMSDVMFLQALYQEGAAQWFDVVAAEPYGFDEGVEQPAAPGRLNFSRAELLREVMLANGDPRTPIWAVAFGWNNGSRDSVVAVLEDAVSRARTEWPWMGPMFWAAWSSRDVQGRYALVQESGQPGAVLQAMRTMTADPGVALPGRYPADHRSGAYQGKWRVTPSGADIGATGDRLTITFEGSRLDLGVRSGDYRAFLYATVDGEPANALPHDRTGQAYLVLYDPQGAKTAATVARGLAPGRHVAEIVAEGGWGQWSITGWYVCNEPESSWPWLPVGTAGASVLFLGAALLGAWPERHRLLSAGRALVGRYRTVDSGQAWLIACAAALCVYVTVGTIPSLAALVLFALVLFLRPDLGLPLIALALPFWQPGKPFLGKVFSMVEILTWLTALAWFVNGALGWWRRRGSWCLQGLPARSLQARLSRLGALDWGIVALTLIGAISLLWTLYVRVAAREFRTVILGSAIFYLLIRSMMRDRKCLWRIADAWMLGGVAVSLIGIGQWISGQNLITAEGVWRVRGLYGSPNNLALYLGRIFPLAVAIAVWDKGERRRWPYGAAAVFIGAAIILTYSRGAWLLGVPLSLLFVAAARGRRPLLLTAGVVLCVIVVAVAVVGPSRVGSLVDAGQGTAFLRLRLWESSVGMIRDHPVLGVGLDNFLYYYRSIYVLPTAWEEFNLSHPHNLVLDFWLRLGLPGLAILGWLLAGFFRRGWQAYRTLPEGEGRLLTLGLMGGMVDFVAHGLVDNAFFLVDLAFVFVMMLALVQSLKTAPTPSAVS